MAWIIDVENNLIHEDDLRHSIICRAGGSLKNPEIMRDFCKIAAAPDMFNALTVLVGVCERAGIPVDAARAALAKAEGK